MQHSIIINPVEALVEVSNPAETAGEGGVSLLAEETGIQHQNNRERRGDY
jgi:hypothetical protein